MLGLLFALFVWYLPIMRLSDGHFPEYFYILLFFSSAVHQVFAKFSAMFLHCSIIVHWKKSVLHISQCKTVQEH